MPTESSFPPVVIPNLDLWAFLFERKDKPFPDDKGPNAQRSSMFGADQLQSSTEMPILTDHIPTPRRGKQRFGLAQA